MSTYSQAQSGSMMLPARSSFPLLMHDILTQAHELKYDHIVSWMPNGNAFIVHDRYEFVASVLPRFSFKLTKYKSFSRQLNMWGFSFIETGPYRGAYSHPMFLRDHRDGCLCITRQRNNKNNYQSLAHQSPQPQPEPFESPSPEMPMSGCPPRRISVTDTVPAAESPSRGSGGNRVSSIDEANALITADIMSFIANEPGIFGEISSKLRGTSVVDLGFEENMQSLEPSSIVNIGHDNVTSTENRIVEVSHQAPIGEDLCAFGSRLDNEEWVDNLYDDMQSLDFFSPTSGHHFEEMADLAGALDPTGTM